MHSKSLVVLLAFLTFLSFSAMVHAAAKKTISAVGNVSTVGVFYDQYQRNSSIKSNQETVFEDKIGLRNSSVCDGWVEIYDLNYTINEEWVVNTRSKIQLLNGTRHVLWESANNTYLEGNNLTVRFNATQVALVNCSSTYTVFYVRWHLDPLDDHRSVSTTSSGNFYTDNVTYTGPTDVDLENVTLVHNPTNFNKIEYIKEVRYDGVVVTNYTKTLTGIEYDPNIGADSTHWLSITYVFPESREGNPPTKLVPPGWEKKVELNPWLLAGLGVMFLTTALVIVALYW